MWGSMSSRGSRSPSWVTPGTRPRSGTDTSRLGSPTPPAIRSTTTAQLPGPRQETPCGTCFWGYPGRLGSGTDDMYRGGETSVRRTAVTSLCCVLLVLSLGVAAAQARLRAPGLQAPGNGATVQSLPAFAWAPLKSAG